jgi:hypothetical protein
VLVDRAIGGDAGGCLLRVLQRDLRLGDRFVIVDAGFVQRFGEVERLFVRPDGLRVERLQSILSAKLEVVLGAGGLLGQPLVFKVGG